LPGDDCGNWRPKNGKSWFLLAVWSLLAQTILGLAIEQG
jgi:hypothetical protein